MPDGAWLVTVLPDEILYNKVKVGDVAEIVRETLVGGKVVDRLLYVDPATKKHCQGIQDIPFYQRQQRFVLKECGTIDPEDIHEYLHHGGYAAAKKAVLSMTPEQIVQEITKSGLRGRGGGGFPTGRKWEAARVQKSAKKYVICNADEGDPGAFMNRSVMEGNPHSVLEGLMIAARAIGADETLIYVRAEYPLAVMRMRRAVEDAQKLGFLGHNVFGSGQALNCEVMEGAGAFVCGSRKPCSSPNRSKPRPSSPSWAQIGATASQLAIAWCARDKRVSTVITGASRWSKWRKTSRPSTSFPSSLPTSSRASTRRSSRPRESWRTDSLGRWNSISPMNGASSALPLAGADGLPRPMTLRSSRPASSLRPFARWAAAPPPSARSADYSPRIVLNVGASRRGRLPPGERPRLVSIYSARTEVLSSAASTISSGPWVRGGWSQALPASDCREDPSSPSPRARARAMCARFRLR